MVTEAVEFRSKLSPENTSEISPAIPPTVSFTPLNLSCSPWSKPYMIALPAGINNLRSYSIGPLWSRIQFAIPPTKFVTPSQADFKPPKKPLTHKLREPKEAAIPVVEPKNDLKKALV